VLGLGDASRETFRVALCSRSPPGRVAFHVKRNVACTRCQRGSAAQWDCAADGRPSRAGSVDRAPSNQHLDLKAPGHGGDSHQNVKSHPALHSATSTKTPTQGAIHRRFQGASSAARAAAPTLQPMHKLAAGDTRSAMPIGPSRGPVRTGMSPADFMRTCARPPSGPRAGSRERSDAAARLTRSMIGLRRRRAAPPSGPVDWKRLPRQRKPCQVGTRSARDRRGSSRPSGTRVPPRPKAARMMRMPSRRDTSLELSTDVPSRHPETDRAPTTPNNTKSWADLSDRFGAVHRQATGLCRWR
jgi:hypothetical protein